MPDKLKDFPDSAGDSDDDDLDSLPRGDNLDAEDDSKKKPKEKAPKEKAPKEVEAEEEEAEEEEAEEEEAEEEEAEEEEAEEEEAEEEEAEEDEGAGKDAKTLAASRAKALRQRDEARDRIKTMEAELAALKGGDKPAEQGKSEVDEINDRLDVLREQVEEFRADAKTKEAATVQREIDDLNRKLLVRESASVAVQANAKQMDNVKFDAYFDIIMAARPDVDKESDEYDSDVSKEFGLLLNAYERTGMSGSAAIRKASKLLLGFDPGQPETIAKAKDTPAAPEKKGKKQDIEKAVNTQKRQAPDISDRGRNKDGGRVSIEDLTDDELEKLPASKVAQMRGDNRI